MTATEQQITGESGFGDSRSQNTTELPNLMFGKFYYRHILYKTEIGFQISKTFYLNETLFFR